MLYLVSSGGAAMRRSIRAAVSAAAVHHELRMLAPAGEVKALRDCAVPTDTWRPAGLFNVLRAIGVLRRAVDRYEPDVIHAFGWTASAVALGALPSRYASRTLVTLQDPVRKNELPKAFMEKRLPELFARSWAVECAYETLRRVLVDVLNVPTQKVRVVPYGVSPLIPPESQRPAGRAGPVVGYAGRLESDRAWEIAIDAFAQVIKQHAAAHLIFGRSGPIAGLVRSHAWTVGVSESVTFSDDLPSSQFFAAIDLLVVPSAFDGLPYVVIESLVNGVPVIGADTGGIADTIAPYAGWLVPDDARGFAAGLEEAWANIDVAWSAAQAQRPTATARFSSAGLQRRLLDEYEHIAGELGSRSGFAVSPPAEIQPAEGKR